MRSYIGNQDSFKARSMRRMWTFTKDNTAKAQEFKYCEKHHKYYPSKFDRCYQCFVEGGTV